MCTLALLLLGSSWQIVATASSSAQTAVPVGKYKGTWRSPPTRIGKGEMPDAPLLGNGDLGISLGADPAAGELTLHLGLNQMWGIRSYNRQANPLKVNDTALPRRLGIGGLSISAAEVRGGSFSAEQSLATAEVRAALTSASGELSVRIYLSPDENIAITEIAYAHRTTTTSVAVAPFLNITSWVIPATGGLNSTCKINSTWPLGERLDGVVSAGVSDGTIWSQRQPLGLQSPMPITVAVATKIPSGAADRKTFASNSSSSTCLAQLRPNATLRLTTALLSNWDLCATAEGCADPLHAALSKVKDFDVAALDKLEASHRQWWSKYWNATYISMPGDPTIERLYYAHSYLIASASRRATTRVAAGLWGPWVHSDETKWNGGYTLDYNFQASYWGLYATNRLDQAWPHYKPILDYIPKAQAAAAFYNCSGLHFPGEIAPFGHDATLAGLPWADMSDHSNGVYLALNMIQHWEYFRDMQFLRSTAFPFARDVMRFYQCWMTRRSDGSWVNTMDQSNECSTEAPVTIERLQAFCYQNNSITANGFIRRVATALPSMATALGEPEDPAWKEIALHMIEPPAVSVPGIGEIFVMAGNFSLPPLGEGECNLGPVGCGTRQRKCPACGPTSGDGPFITWPIFPAESISLASPQRLQRIARNTLTKSNSWSQMNAFSSIFSQAARVAMPLDQWFPRLHDVIQNLIMPNLIVSQLGGGLEVAGALQMVADLMLQSVTLPDATGHSYMALFPLNITHTDISFHRLRAKGGFVVSAAWDSGAQRLDGPVVVHAEVTGRCAVQLPWPAQAREFVVHHLGKEVATVRQGDRLAFETKAGGDYSIGERIKLDSQFTSV